MLSLPEAVVVVGGLGTRLSGVVGDKPKCMAPIARPPFLEYLFCFVRSQGIGEVILGVGYRADQVVEHFGDGIRHGLKLSYSCERSLLGTGGALKLAASLVRGNGVLVMNGDSIADVPLKALVEYHTQKCALATIVLAEVPDVARYGAVVLGRDGQIVRFKEKSVEGKGWVNAGIYVLEREVVANIPSERQVSLERDVFERLAGCGLYGFSFNGFFIDIGTPEPYDKAQLELPGRFLCRSGRELPFG